ncbi:MAG: BNR repeat-containing protein [Chitinophagaceae bacterium]
MHIRKVSLFVLIILLVVENSRAQTVKTVNVEKAWAGNSINAVVFRKNSLVSFGKYQFISFYDSTGYVVIGKRKLSGQKWELKKTIYKGNIKDAHNSISIMVDGDGYLHLAWDHHNSVLRYCRSKTPLSLDMSEPMPMTGTEETKVSYPEFYKMPSGDLLFFYRDGGSGNGNLVINSYNRKEKAWKRIQTNLIDGEGKRNAYWQACVDIKGSIHISWVWRESPDVASNHDMNYAVSKDGGASWQRSDGTTYQLPINLSSAEKIVTIPQNSELINQTSMCADKNGHPYIASYWKGKNNIPQYHVIYNTGNSWEQRDLGFRSEGFSLSGMGTKMIPISRPQIICFENGKTTDLDILFRDQERGNKISIASTQKGNTDKWVVRDLYNMDTGSWEPTYDTELWKQKKQLHVFVQQVKQADGEGITNTAAQMIQVIECKM